MAFGIKRNVLLTIHACTFIWGCNSTSTDECSSQEKGENSGKDEGVAVADSGRLQKGTSVRGLKLLVYEALSCLGLKLLVYEALSYSHRFWAT